MQKIKAIEMKQQNIKMYLTSFRLKDIRNLFDKRQLIVDKYDPANPEGREGYQRGVDDPRVDDIANFLSGKIDILPPLLPSSMILNCRNSGTLRYIENTSELIINDDTVFHVVDGQHRIQGLVRSKVKEYDVPATIIDGLNISKEAGQFLTINTKQKKVKPDLQLRILYHQDRSNTRKLINALGIENWKLEALTLSIALNDRNESPWRNLILRPGEKRDGRWKPIPEGHFVETLKFFCSPESPIKLIEIEEKEKFLINYWDALRKLYKSGFSEEKGKNYSIAGGKGAGIFHTMASIIFYLNQVENRDIISILQKIPKYYPLEEWWRKPRGKITRSGSGQGVFREWAEKIIKKVDKRLNYLDENNLERLERRTQVEAYSKVLRKARSMLSPLILRSADRLSQDNLNIRGCYVFIRLKDDGASAYVGKSQDAKKRLKSHGKYDLFAVRECRDEREMEDLEMGLYHLVKTNFRENDNHPSPVEHCPYCSR